MPLIDKTPFYSKEVIVQNRFLFTAFAAAAILTISGCVVRPLPTNRVYYTEEIVETAPPPPRVEYVGSPPIVGQIWIGGFWNWTGRRHEWVRGHWETPRPGHTWIPYHWERRGNQWVKQGGYWSNGNRAGQIQRPPGGMIRREDRSERKIQPRNNFNRQDNRFWKNRNR